MAAPSEALPPMSAPMSAEIALSKAGSMCISPPAGRLSSQTVMPDSRPGASLRGSRRRRSVLRSWASTRARRPNKASGLLLHSADRGFGRAGEIVRQQIARARPHPLVEVDLLKLALVPGLHDLEIVVPGVLDGVAEARRDVDGIARAYFRDLAASARSEQRDLSFAAQIVVKLVGLGVPMQIALLALVDDHQPAGHGF